MTMGLLECSIYIFPPRPEKNWGTIKISLRKNLDPHYDYGVIRVFYIYFLHAQKKIRAL